MKLHIVIHDSVTYVPKGSAENQPSLVQLMAWRRTGTKPLPEQVMTKIADSNMRNQVSR